MDFKFSKGGDDTPQAEHAGEKKNQSALLVLLLLLVGGFVYIYFFTGLIRPKEASKPAEAPAPQVAKIPLPARDGEGAKASAKPSEPRVDASVKQEPPKPAPASAVVPPPAAVAPSASKAPSVPKEEPKKVELAKTAEKKQLPAPVAVKTEPNAATAKPEEKKSPVAEKKQPAPEKKTEPVKPEAAKAAVVAQNKKNEAKKQKPAGSEAPEAAKSWTLTIGSYVLEDALSTDLVRVRKVGLEPVVKSGAHKKTAMNRLLFSEFKDRPAAQAALEKLKRHTSDAFIIDHAGSYTVYAGSYLLDARAASEKERLASAGFPLIVKRAEIAIPSKSLTVGPFISRKSAGDALEKLKSSGIKAVLSSQ